MVVIMFLQAAMSEWWHLEGWPTPAEWQAAGVMLGALTTVGAVLFAGMQLRKMSEANRQASEAARDQVRPYVQVSLKLEMLPASNPKEESLPDWPLSLCETRVHHRPGMFSFECTRRSRAAAGEKLMWTTQL